MASHLTILIKRVKAIPQRMKTEPVFWNKLVNLAEYIHYEDDYSDFEQRKAKALLKVYHLEYLLEIVDDDEFERAIQSVSKEKGAGSRVCIRCGRTLTDPQSVRRGYGPECFEKAGIILDDDLEKYFGEVEE